MITILEKDSKQNTNIYSILTTNNTSCVNLGIFMLFVLVKAKICWNNKGPVFMVHGVHGN